MINILWHDHDSAGFTDILPLRWFAGPKTLKGEVHEVIGPRLGRYKAQCDVHVAGKNATLDYRPYTSFNEHWGMYLGVMRIQFSDIYYRRVSQVKWKQSGRHSFEDCSVTVSIQPNTGVPLRSLEDDFARKVAESSRSPAQRKERLKWANPRPGRTTKNIEIFNRNPDVVAEVLERANGSCEHCTRDAPFRRTSDDKPYLEVHHKITLANDGDDTVENAIALCPNCHRHAHYGPAM